MVVVPFINGPTKANCSRYCPPRTCVYLWRNCYANPIGWLEPGFAGSNPTCPASQCGLCGTCPPSREGRSSTDGGRRPAPGPRQIMSAVAARPSRWMARTTYRGRSRNPDEISLRYAFRFSADIWSTFWSWSSNASSNAWTVSSLKNRPPDICRHSSPVKLRLVLSLIANSPS